ncbi:DNA-processing protein [Desulfonema limicola]|uniref:DNA-processing protein n=1 Tax=Desulfonema limicola TaxID=45656 RepID=A0A975GI91_9BACT|nr:DNA-processing protein DprA [Desulfonema limicola]QTA82425.1 DNA-processing protein [Desulfonema limicola]
MDQKTAEILPWFILRSVPGIGNLLFKRLLDRFKLPENALTASYEELVSVNGITDRLARAVIGHKTSDPVKREIELIDAKGCKIITMKDPEYPGLLLQIPDPPPFLYVYGDLGSCSANIAVVGSRNATRYGMFTTKKLSADLAVLKFTIVSGMARGIDTAAHSGALDAGGKTIAVLGSGFEKVYPAENIALFHRIARSGAVITEFPLNAGPEPHHFPVRNRIISGISLGTVIVEAAKKSGSLITARLALEQNREVFAVPGNIHSFKSAGTHSLIKQGAKLVENAQDIVEELSHLIRFHMAKNHISPEDILKHAPRLSPEQLQVVQALGPYPVHIDELIRKLSINPGNLSSILLQLELKGIVVQSPGKMFSIELDKDVK